MALPATTHQRSPYRDAGFYSIKDDSARYTGDVMWRRRTLPLAASDPVPGGDWWLFVEMPPLDDDAWKSRHP